MNFQAFTFFGFPLGLTIHCVTNNKCTGITRAGEGDFFHSTSNLPGFCIFPGRYEEFYRLPLSNLKYCSWFAQKHPHPLKTNLHSYHPFKFSLLFLRLLYHFEGEMSNISGNFEEREPLTPLAATFPKLCPHVRPIFPRTYQGFCTNQNKSEG